MKPHSPADLKNFNPEGVPVLRTGKRLVTAYSPTNNWLIYCGYTLRNLPDIWQGVIVLAFIDWFVAIHFLSHYLLHIQDYYKFKELFCGYR